MTVALEQRAHHGLDARPHRLAPRPTRRHRPAQAERQRGGDLLGCLVAEHAHELGRLVGGQRVVEGEFGMEAAGGFRDLSGNLLPAKHP